MGAVQRVSALPACLGLFMTLHQHSVGDVGVVQRVSNVGVAWAYTPEAWACRRMGLV